MAKFHPLKVSDIKRETEDTVSIAFEVPAELKEDYKFIQGQYLTFKMQMNGQEIRRNYSICRSPMDNDLRVAVKRVEGGAFSEYANDKLKIGDTLEVMTPHGRFYTELNPANEKHYVAFAAGSGITPVMAHLRTILALESKSEFTLIYSNKTTAHIVFKEEIEDLKNEYMDRFRVFHVLSREATEIPFLQGRVDEEKVEFLLKYFIPTESIDDVFLCGPAPMIDAVRATLEKAGLERKQIHFELFASPQQLAERAGQKATAPEHGKGFQADVSIILDGITTSFKMDSENTSILDAALQNGADLPYACKGGVCATCRAKLEQGQVRMDLNYSLEPDELERGFILTCQSHPTTEKVLVNFDEA